MERRKLEYIKVEELKAYARNARTHSEEQIEQVIQSIQEFGFTNPVLIDEENELIAGHGRTEAAKRMGMTDVPAIRLIGLSDEQKRALRIADNQIALNAGWDEEILSAELEALSLADFDMDLLGFSLEELDNYLTRDVGQSEGDDDYENYAESGSLVKRYGIPPFSIFDTRSGDWQARKTAWREYGIESEKGREGELVYNNESLSKHYSTPQSGTSIFDPVLCELAYSWFSPEDGVVVDPFAGGSVRGIVAAKLGRQYIGVDLRQEQIDENRKQWDGLPNKSSFSDGAQEVEPAWHCGNSLDIDKTLSGIKADMVFSCPPYADLEKYSDDPADLSNMEYQEFLTAYREIIKKSCDMLKPDRFACFVVGEVRDKNGIYRGFVNDTVEAFEAAGLSFYNEIILINPAGTLPLRVQKIFNASRKIGKCHQNILIFVKGDPKNATIACGTVEMPEIEMDE